MRKVLIIGILLLSATLVMSFDNEKSEQRLNEPEMVFVKGGTFQMGSESEEANNNEKPIHDVTLSSYYIGKYEVTVSQFATFVEATKYKTEAEEVGVSFVNVFGEIQEKENVNWRHDIAGNIRPASESNHPVVHITWRDAMAYCEWLSREKGEVYRLPTEAEWEFAARGGVNSNKNKYSGSNEIEDVAWYTNNCFRTHTVGTKKPNELGIYDMSGNVWEWNYDWYADDYYANSPLLFPLNQQEPDFNANRVARGGCWSLDKEYCRNTHRVAYSPYMSSYNIGFRVVCQV